MKIEELSNNNTNVITAYFKPQNNSEKSQLTKSLNDSNYTLMNDGLIVNFNVYELYKFINAGDKLNFSDQELSKLENIYENRRIFWKGKRFNFELTRDPIVYSIVNCTPDSFYDGDRERTTSQILDRIKSDLANGASVIELGGKSSKPNFDDISPEEEWGRLDPVLKAIKEIRPDAILAVDTNEDYVMERLLEKYDIDIINDIDGFDTERKLELIKEYKPAVVAMSNEREVKYNEPSDMNDYFEEKIKQLLELGLEKEKITIDPGVGFYLKSSPEKDIQKIMQLSELNQFQLPVMIAISRKGFLGEFFDIRLKDRLLATLIVEFFMVQNGGRLLRVHDVAETRDLLNIISVLYK